MPEKGDNFYQNISLARQESIHENDICCSGHLNVNVLQKAKKFIDLLPINVCNDLELSFLVKG